ncbi:MAG: FG-GAP repeat protein [Candidatus Omnitrophica bacterium]|nr:FG-GAP repeat protein [Candidatus Omnitrophota bacterium]
MRFWSLNAAVLGLALAASAGAHAMENQKFVYRAASLDLPDFLTEGRLFLDPEMAFGNWFGGGVTVGDWDRDGYNDIFISSFLADPDGVENAGAIYVFLGPDFTETERITALPEPEEGDNFGMQIEFADMNGDSSQDLVTTCLRSRWVSSDESLTMDQAGSFRIVWGPDYAGGIRLFDEYPEAGATLGRGLAAADFNMDGNMDLAIGGIGAYGALGKVIFRYGPDFNEQSEILSPIIENGMRFGVSLAAGDWNADGYVDLIAGADKVSSESGLDKAGQVQIWLGPDYREDQVIIFEESNPEVDRNFGASVDFGDLTGDGVPDLVVGISNAKWENKSWVGQVQIYPGPDYEEMIELNSPIREENSIFGSEIKIADVNGDGCSDLVVGEYYATVDGLSMAGRAWLFLGVKTEVETWSLF